MKKQLILVAIMLFAASCKKNADQPLIAGSYPSLNLAGSNETSPGNSLNPYDSTGYWHNRILVYLNGRLGSADHSTANICNAIARFPDAAISPAVIQQLPGSITQDTLDVKDGFQKRIAVSPYGLLTKKYLQALMDTVGGMQTQDYPALKFKITTLEDHVVNDNLLVPDERKVILQATAIARYSAYYWTFNYTPPIPAASFKRIIWWIATITTDAASGIGRAAGGGSITDAAAGAAGDSRAIGTLIDDSIPGY